MYTIYCVVQQSGRNYCNKTFRYFLGVVEMAKRKA